MSFFKQLITRDWCPSTRYAFVRVSVAVSLSLSLLSLELPCPQEPILAQRNNLVVVWCHQHVHYFFEGSCWVIEGAHRAKNRVRLVHFQSGEETLVVCDQNPIAAPKGEGLDVGHWEILVLGFLESRNNKLVIHGVSNLNLAGAGTNENQVEILLKMSDTLGWGHW